MSRTKSLLRTLLIIGAASAAAVFGTFSAFSATTDNAGNRLKTGDVDISDNDAASPLYLDLAAKPGQTFSKCIKVTYSGSLDADVKLYSSAVGALGDYVDLTITPGTQASSTGLSCTGFTADSSGPIFNGELDDFAATYSSWSNGLVDGPGSATYWTSGQSVAYRFDVTIQNVAAAEGLDTNAHTFTWEAQNR